MLTMMTCDLITIELVCVSFTRQQLPGATCHFRPHPMHEMQTVANDDPVAWAYYISVTRASVLTHSPDGALHSGHYYITVATC